MLNLNCMVFSGLCLHFQFGCLFSFRLIFDGNSDRFQTNIAIPSRMPGGTYGRIWAWSHYSWDHSDRLNKWVFRSLVLIGWRLQSASIRVVFCSTSGGMLLAPQVSTPLTLDRRLATRVVRLFASDHRVQSWSARRVRLNWRCQRQSH